MNPKYREPSPRSGSASRLKAIHGDKTKNDKLYATKLGTLLRGAFPQAYV